MADNFLITGYWGKPHVTSENDRGLNAATFGAGRFVLPVGEQFRAEYIGNNTIRMYDGKLMDNGAAAGIPAGEYMDLLITNAGQGMKRNDLIIFQYQRDSSTMVESGTFLVLSGTETTGTASDPVLTQADLLSGNAAFDQMALWRVSVSGTAISAPVQVFSVSKNLQSEVALNNSSVTTAKIASKAVTNAKIADGAVSEGKIADGAVSTAKVADGAVTFDKLHTSSVGTTRIMDNAVTTAKIKDGAVTASKVGSDVATTAYVDGKRIEGTCALTASGWSNGTQTKTSTRVLGTDMPHWCVVYSSDANTREAEKEAFALVDVLETSDGKFTFRCFGDVPTVDLTIQWEVNR
jgi:hypothetical protein